MDFIWICHVYDELFLEKHREDEVFNRSLVSNVWT